MTKLEEQLSSILAAEIQKEIDFDVLSKVLVESGWVRVVLKPMAHETSEAIDAWLEQHCAGRYMTLGLVFIFKEQKDANWFALKWL